MFRNSNSDQILSDMVFGVLEEFGDQVQAEEFVDEIDDAGDENSSTAEENKEFWEAQEKLVQGTLCRTSSIESTIRNSTKEAIKELKAAGIYCRCPKPVEEGCRNCLQREICNSLRNLGYNCVIRKSKWRSSPEILPGEHTYLEVMDNSCIKKGEVRIVIELNLRGEFEMARASQEYNHLISQLPEVYVGKAERLQALIKILCSAAKKCMKDKKMHLGPWRKHKYMKAKWLGTSGSRMAETTSATPFVPVAEFSVRPPRPKASLLSIDLVGNLPKLHCPAVAVV
ncbi:Protein of unknown function PDDEXK-like [Dillenia turbinata]|uniref:Uncharacterized protein n=1 Tax=Dillenia turbinata TaxID=194707 RepID=A0AAN8YY86_9MAGN